MGVSIAEIRAVLDDAGVRGNIRKRVLDIGTQNVYHCTQSEVVEFVNDYNDSWAPDDLAFYAKIVEAGSATLDGHGINGAWLGDILSRAGFDYVAYDIFHGYNTSIMDLNNESVREDDRGAFDVVLNCGTSEHILNQYNVLNVVHDATRVGGVMYHAIPMTGYLEHGYFTYTPKLFCELALANDYEILRMDFAGPQGGYPIDAGFVSRVGIPCNPADGFVERWHGVTVFDSILAVTLRRRNAAPFRASLEASTAAAAVAGSVLSTYGRGGPGTDAGDDHEKKELEERMQAVLRRFSSPDLAYDEIVELSRAYARAYGDEAPFPIVLEKKALDLAIAAHPDRDDLRFRLENVERLLEEEWSLYRFRNICPADQPIGLAMDGVEASLLSGPTGRERFDNAVSAFCRYLDAGFPERFPVMLEYEALGYAAETVDRSYNLLQCLGAAAGKLTTQMTLRRRQG